MTTQTRQYMAYLVRLWQVNREGQSAWRASIEDPHTGERRGFADLESLFAFLKEQCVFAEKGVRVWPIQPEESTNHPIV